MSDDKTKQEVKIDQPKARKTLGREELFDVFKTGGEAELFARPAEKKHKVDTQTRTGPLINRQIHDASGPTITHQMNDASGPIIRNAEFNDGSGPTIAHQLSDETGPVIKKTEIVDADGPTISHEMNDATGPIIKNADSTDADGPMIAHQMNDATGPIIKRTLENTRAKAPTLNNPLSSTTKTVDAGLGHQPKTDTQSGQAHRMDTFSVHMAERIAQMKSAQKETMTKMDELEASTNEMQSKPTATGKK